MGHEKIARLISKLSERTEEGKLNWEQTESQGIFQASFPGYAIRLRKESSESEYNEVDFDIVLAIFDSQGELIEEVRDTELGEDMERPYFFMSRLYDQARRRAMGVEQALDALLEELDNDIPF
jgi:hypothetical protein